MFYIYVYDVYDYICDCDFWTKVKQSQFVHVILFSFDRICPLSAHFPIFPFSRNREKTLPILLFWRGVLMEWVWLIANPEWCVTLLNVIATLPTLPSAQEAGLPDWLNNFTALKQLSAHLWHVPMTTPGYTRRRRKEADIITRL